MDEHLKKAITILQGGGIVIFPTDTAFGIGCRIDNQIAIEKLFRIRRRSQTQATPVLSASLAMLEPYLLPISQDIIDTFITPFWPGALTLVLPCREENVSVLIRGGTQTLGVRIPNHLETLEMIRGVGVPVVGTSANFHGHPTPFLFEDLDQELVKQVDYVVPGKCHMGQASTVLNLAEKPWKILRQGAVDVSKFV